jgi:hypothetical protein
MIAILPDANRTRGEGVSQRELKVYVCAREKWWWRM